MENEEKPFESPAALPTDESGSQEQSGSQKQTAGRTMYVHAVAMLGALVAFIGGFGAAFVLPTMFSQTLASSRQWVTTLLAAGVIVGLLCAALSYRATLRTHRNR